jgi:DNA-binding Lrp family transcriptional regulator
MAKKTIKLTTQEELNIFMSPQRQKLMRHMRIAGKAATSKDVAGFLGISTSSAQFHIKKLEKLGIVELDHTERINGILAKYYRMADINVRIGSYLGDEHFDERNVIMENLMKGTFDGLIEFYETGISEEDIAKYSEFVNGFINLTPEDSKELLRMMREFISTHEKSAPNTEVWEYTLMLYNTSVKKNCENVDNAKE